MERATKRRTRSSARLTPRATGAAARGVAGAALVALSLGAVARGPLQTAPEVRGIVWDDVAPPLQRLLGDRGIDRAAFAGYIADARTRNRARVREGELDHLVYYALQSSAFTRLPPIEPALSAKQFVDRLPVGGRARFLAGGDVPGTPIPRSVQARIDALAAALAAGARDDRLAYFREVVTEARSERSSWRPYLVEQYVRAMRFLYEKEFGAAQSRGGPAVDGLLYQARGLSTDTSVEAGYVVYLALAALRQLEPERRIRRVLIVGPGLDVAPRTGLVEASAPQSYQPFAVIDAILGLGLADRATLRVTGADINPHVVDWLRRTHGSRPRLTLVSSIAETDRVHVTEDYRAYFASLGRAIGLERPLPGSHSRRLGKSVEIASGMTDTIDATLLDIVVDRVDERYDLVVVTNVFPYLSDPDLLLALTNIVGMLAPRGVLLHNEARPLLADLTLAVGLTLIHSRSAVIATVKGARSPLYDAVWLHRASS